MSMLRICLDGRQLDSEASHHIASRRYSQPALGHRLELFIHKSYESIENHDEVQLDELGRSKSNV
uniref:Uncharacterized protein n=1 Tax=Bionectria ochroleuca TaxID=29856 RepID=A0A0B7KGB5_BIOOC